MSNIPTSNDISFGTLLATIRAARSLTQAEVAEKTGIDQSLISRYESRGLSPSLPHIQALERFLGLKFNSLLVLNAVFTLAGLPFDSLEDDELPLDQRLRQNGETELPGL